MQVVQDIFEIRVYIQRLNDFLNSEEIDFDFMKKFDSAGGLDIIKEDKQACQHSLIIRDASFYWGKKDDGENSLTDKDRSFTNREKLRKDEHVDMKTERKSRANSGKLQDSLNQDSDIDLLLNHEKDMDNENITKSSFAINNDETEYIGFTLHKIDLKIAKNSLTFVLGKIGSGKTSL